MAVRAGAAGFSVATRSAARPSPVTFRAKRLRAGDPPAPLGASLRVMSDEGDKSKRWRSTVIVGVIVGAILGAIVVGEVVGLRVIFFDR